MTYPATPTFWLEPTDQVAIGLRRYTPSRPGAEGHGCDTGYHSALIYTGTAPATYRDDEHGRVLAARPATPHDDPRWPAACTKCGHEFGGEGEWQDWQELLYRRADTGETVTLRTQPADVNAPAAAPPGAMVAARSVARLPPRASFYTLTTTTPAVRATEAAADASVVCSARPATWASVTFVIGPMLSRRQPSI